MGPRAVGAARSPREPRGSAGRRRDGASDSSASPTRADRIEARVRAIPEGFVRTYGDIDPTAPRLVGRVLATTDTDGLPWHRVVRADGTVPKGATQRRRLLREGVPMRGDRVDMARARIPFDSPAEPTEA